MSIMITPQPSMYRQWDRQVVRIRYLVDGAYSGDAKLFANPTQKTIHWKEFYPLRTRPDLIGQGHGTIATLQALEFLAEHFPFDYHIHHSISRLVQCVTITTFMSRISGKQISPNVKEEESQSCRV
jgi:hypothetical protein